MKKQDDFTFNGFEPANTTPVPDVLFDELLSQLTGAELKVLLYIIRRTKGFKKDTDAISLSQFQKGILTRDGRQLDKGCGIGDRQTIIDALTSLEKKKCIVSEKGKTSIGDNATTTYRIYFSQGVVGKTNHLVGKVNHGSMENPTTVVDFSNHGSSENQLPVVGNSNPQETVLQDTDSQEGVIPEESNSAHTDTDTFAPPDVGAHSLPDFITCFFCSLPMEIRCSHCGKRVCSQHATTYDAGDTWCEACVWLAENTSKPPQVIDASLSQSIDTDYHSQSLPLSSAVTTRNEEGDTHGTDNTHSSASHPHSREPGIDLTPARNGSQADNPAYATVYTTEQRPSQDTRREQEIAPQEGAPDHAQPLPSVPAANSPHRGSSDVPGDSQMDSTGTSSAFDAPPVDCAAGSDAVGGAGRTGVAEDTARGIGSREAREAGAAGGTARGQVDEGDDHAHLPAGSARGDGALPGAGSDSHDAAVDDRHVAAPEARPDVATGQEEIDILGRAWQHVDPEQTASREDVPAVAASLLDTSTVEPGHGGWDTVPAAPVTEQQPAQGQEGKRTGKRKAPAKAEEPPKSDTKEVQKRIDTHRGYPLEEKVDIIRERQAVKTWCGLHTLEQYDVVMDEMKRDPYWGKPENYFRIGGLTLLRETSRVLAKVERRQASNLRVVPPPEPVDKSKLFNMEHIVLPRKGVAR